VIEPNGFTGATLTSYGASISLPELAGAELTVTGSDSACNQSSGSVLASNTDHDGTVNPVFPNDSKTQRFRDAFTLLPRTKIGRLKSVPVSVDQSASTATESAKRSIHAAAGLGGKSLFVPGPQRSTPERVRSAALADLRSTLTQALYPCLTAGTGTIVFGTLGVVIGPIVGATMVRAAAPVCAGLVARLHSLTLVYDDPPVSGYRRVAHVRHTKTRPLPFAACPRSPASARRFCGRLHAAVQSWFAALGHTSAVAAALAKTVGRESAAANAGDRAALKRQRTAALALLPKLRAALRSERSARKAVARLLRSVHAHGDITSAQIGQALGAILADLRRAHTNVAQVQQAAPAELRPRAVDALALLGR
jgi:hypothetical protein